MKNKTWKVKAWAVVVHQGFVSSFGGIGNQAHSIAVFDEHSQAEKHHKDYSEMIEKFGLPSDFPRIVECTITYKTEDPTKI